MSSTRPASRRGCRAGRAAAARRRRLADQHRGADLRGLRRPDPAAVLGVHQPVPAPAGPGRARRPRLRREPDRDPADPAHRDRPRAGRGRARRAAARAGRAGLLRRRQPQLPRQPAPGDAGRAHRGAAADQPAARDVRPSPARLALLHGQDRGRAPDVAPAGRRARLAGVPRDLGLRDRRLRAAGRHHGRAAGARLAARAAHALGRADPGRRAHRLAAARAGAPSCARGSPARPLNGALAEGIHGVRTVQGMGREAVNLQLFEEKVDDNLESPAAAAPGWRRSWCRSSTR